MDTDTGSLARSILAQALYCPTWPTDITCKLDSTNESSVPLPPEVTGPALLSSSSRLIIKQFRGDEFYITVSRHATVAFNQDQFSSILQIVAVESARASFDKLNSVVVRASQLNLRSPAGTTSRARSRKAKDPETDTDTGSDSVMTYNTRGEDSSPVFTSDPKFRRDFQSSVSLPVPLIGVSGGHLNQCP